MVEQGVLGFFVFALSRRIRLLTTWTMLLICVLQQEYGDSKGIHKNNCLSVYQCVSVVALDQ